MRLVSPGPPSANPDAPAFHPLHLPDDELRPSTTAPSLPLSTPDAIETFFRRRGASFSAAPTQTTATLPSFGVFMLNGGSSTGGSDGTEEENGGEAKMMKTEEEEEEGEAEEKTKAEEEEQTLISEVKNDQRSRVHRGGGLITGQGRRERDSIKPVG